MGDSIVVARSPCVLRRKYPCMDFVKSASQSVNQHSLSRRETKVRPSFGTHDALCQELDAYGGT
jgi:hypothetical protein